MRLRAFIQLKIFIFAIFISIGFWWGINIFQKNLESFIYAKIIEKNPPIFLSAQISQNYIKDRPLRISAQSAILVKIDSDKEEILYEKNSDRKTEIASLAKLMTGIIVSEFYQSDSKIKISEKAIAQPEEKGKLLANETLKVKDLLRIMLMESSNDAAYALAETIGVKGFTDLMNLKAKDMGLENTYFYNFTGLDEGKFTNYSTTKDLVKIGKYLLKKPEILEMLGEKEYILYLEDGKFHHILYNTNELLKEIPEIIAGKTGTTPKAEECLFLILKNKKSESFFINVILNSKDRFRDAREILKYFELGNSK